MPDYGTFKYRIPLTTANRNVLKTVEDSNDGKRTKFTWDPLLTEEVLSLFKHPMMGIHNVREPKINTEVMRDVRESLVEYPAEFWLKHNGFVFVAESHRNINEGDKKFLELTFNFNVGLQGCLNGNSSRATLLDTVKNGLMDTYKETGIRPQLNISIYTGLNPEEQRDLGIGRNEQFSVSDSTVANANGLYEDIKKVLKETKLESMVAYKQNEIKPIHIDKIIQTIVAMDNIGFPDADTNPILSYVSKTSPRNYFENNLENNPKQMHRLMVLIPDFLKLRDVIARDFVEFYKKNPRAKGIARIHEITKNGKTFKVPPFYKHTGTNDESKELHILGITVNTTVQEAMIMPILSAFRVLLTNDINKDAEWNVKGGFPSILKIWKKYGPTIVFKIVYASSELGTPNSTAKSNRTWRDCYEVLAERIDEIII